MKSTDIQNIINESLFDEVKKTILRESSAFNDGGEPMMTHNQFRDYSEPSDEEFDDYPYQDDNDNINIERDFINDIKSIGFYVETFNGQEYFIRCKDSFEDFMIYFPNDETIEIYDTKNNEQKQEFGYQDAVDYVLKNKNNLLTFDESVRARNREMDIDSQDRINNRAEMGGLNEEVNKGDDVYHITCEGEPVETFENEDEAMSHLDIYKKKHPEKEFIIEKKKYNSPSDMIDKLDAMGEKLEVKENKTMEKNTVKNFAHAVKDAKEKGLKEFKLNGETHNVDESWRQLEEEEGGQCEGCSQKMEEDSDIKESNAFILAADNAKDEGKKEFEFPKGSGKMHKVTITTDIDTNEEEMGEGSDDNHMTKEDVYEHEYDSFSTSGKNNEIMEEKLCECGGGMNEGGMCNECGKMMYESKKRTLRLTEREMVDMISRMVSESDVITHSATKKAQQGSKKENDDYMKQVEDKLKKASSFDGADNPEFPKQNGKGEKMVINATPEQDEYTETHRGGTLADLDYDQEPSENFKKRLKMALEGDPKMGNSQDAANVIKTDTGKNIGKTSVKKKEIEKDAQEISWGHSWKSPEKVIIVKESKKTNMSSVLNEEIERMKKMYGYDKKTQ